MSEYENTRVLEGLERVCPVPRGAMEYGLLTRWRHIRDGLKFMIELLPMGERGLAARLQEHWAYASWHVEELKSGEPSECLLPY